MNIELIILQKSSFDVSFAKRNGKLYFQSVEIINSDTKINFNISEIAFEKENHPTLYLLFCIDLYAYEEIAKYSHKMILMNAIYPFLGEIVRNFDFAGVVCLRHIITQYPMMFGLKTVLKKMKNIPQHGPWLDNERYGTIYKPDMKISEIIQEYLLLYHEYLTTNNNQNQKE